MFSLLLAFILGAVAGAMGLRQWAIYVTTRRLSQMKAKLSAEAQQMSDAFEKDLERVDMVIAALSRANLTDNRWIGISLTGFFSEFEKLHGRYPTASQLDAALAKLKSDNVEVETLVKEMGNS